MCRRFSVSVNVLVYRRIKLVYPLRLTGLDRIGYAMLKVILEYDLRRAVERRPDRRKLNKNVGAVTSAFDHALNGLQMSYRSRKTVHDRFGAFVAVRMVVVRMLVRLVILNIGSGLMLVAVDDPVTVIVVKQIIGCVHYFSPSKVLNHCISVRAFLQE